MNEVVFTGVKANYPKAMPKKLNKAAIATALFDRLDRKVTLSEVAGLVDVVFDEMKRAIIQEGKLMITGFGVFDVREKAARVGRNPKTGEPLPIAARRVVRFKVSTALKGEMNAGERQLFDACLYQPEEIEELLEGGRVQRDQR